MGDFRVELDAVSRLAGAEHLHRERVALREQLGAGRQVKAFPVPLVDVAWPRAAHVEAGLRRPDRVVTDLHVTVAVAEHRAAEVPGEHLGAEADAEERLSLPERDGEPVGLAADELVLVVGALGSAENDRAGMVRQGRGQGLAEPRAADVEGEAASDQGVTEPAGSRVLLVENDEDRRGHRRDRILLAGGANRDDSYRVRRFVQI